MRKYMTFALAAIMALSFSITAFAKEGPSEYYDSYQGSGNISVGDDIAPGIYMVFNSRDSANATISIRADGKTILNDSFWYNYIIDVEDGDRVYLGNSYLVDMDEAYVLGSEEGFYKVGDGGTVAPGEYSVDWIRGSGTATATVYKQLYYSNDEEYKAGDWKESVTVSRGSTSSITLNEGDYVKLSGCRLIDFVEKD